MVDNGTDVDISSNYKNSRKDKTMKTRFEQIQEMDIKEMTKFLCNLTQATLEFTDVDDICDYCSASKFCKFNHTGFEDWLSENSNIGMR